MQLVSRHGEGMGQTKMWTVLLLEVMLVHVFLFCVFGLVFGTVLCLVFGTVRCLVFGTARCLEIGRASCRERV